jgi:4-amino-4-deoxy-L-arabinose transferase-like glycosyltransferase
MSLLGSDPVGVPSARLADTAAVAMLIALAWPLFFVKLGSAGLVDPDEPYYAVPALEMLKANSWAVPLFRGQPWFDKPVLFYWMILAAFKTFGVSEWAARIGSALSGLGGALAVATLAPARFRRSGAHVLAAVVLATSLEYALLSRTAVTDMTLTFFLTLGFLTAARHLESGGSGAAFAAGCAFGLATLTKGPVGVIVPCLALAGYGVATGRREMLALRPLAAGATGFVTTAAPWYLYMLIAHHDLLLTEFLSKENLGRFMSPEHRQVPLFYVWVLAAGMMPWSAALPAALGRAVRDWRNGEDRTGSPPGTVFALAWFTAVVGVFSVSASRLSTYVLPAFPAAAFLIADFWRDAFARPRHEARTGPLTVAWLSAAVSAAGAGAMLVFAHQGRFPDAGVAVAVLAALVIGATVAAVAAVRVRRADLFAAVQAASTVAIMLVIVSAWPAIEPSESTKTLIAKLEADGLAGQLAGAYRVRDVSLDFYLGRAVAFENDPGELLARVKSDPNRLWVVPAGDSSLIGGGAPFVVTPVMTVSRRSVVRLSPRRS